MATKIMSATKVRRNFTQVVEALGTEGGPLYITHRGEPTAVLVGYKTFEALIEKLEDLSDIVEIYEAQGEPARPLEEVMAEMAGEHVPSPA
ncbi:MAG: type II toxin-antitoxin system Phd/YefM family antitoxin [Anaerolineae bacterium]